MNLVYQLILSIEVSGAAIVLKHWMKLLVEITTATTTIIMTAIITAISSCLSTGSVPFLPSPPTPTIPFLDSSELVFEVFSIEVSGAVIWLNLDEPLWRVQRRPGCLVLTLVQVRASR